MKLTTDEILKAHETQIITNSVRLQAILDILTDNGIIEPKEFVNKVQVQLEEIETVINERMAEPEDETPENEYPYYGTHGEA